MRNITHLFSQNTYVPVKALVFFKKQDSYRTDSVYVESYDISDKGQPINAHPLTEVEGRALARKLVTTKEKRQVYLESSGLLPESVLSIRYSAGQVIWYLPAGEQELFFQTDLGIPSGKANTPALLFRASRNLLEVFALKDKKRPTLKSKLYNAPFFNISAQGLVCMGTAVPRIPADCSLEDFIQLWQSHFFNSYFSHLNNTNPLSIPIVPLWNELISTDKPFPLNALVASSVKLSSLLDI
ncbi:prokaryotic E2 ligase family D protein [Tellurirhabdus bombi]|uniref:prokaryotic E2 ligase family D protein n=1 Tax=Tellurirhabdus bombi TaxID=2907205 RepID=UPI001F491DFA|nr:prokaryotic E2 ligase family D protein [Tellurirhabdus bombi]